ncbi:hypothetical protein FOLKNPGA_03505 [Legionella sp. PC1000]|nr:hypothetical protein FOLKNPGA_03505 [Legionella sp. PC1000]
MGVDILLKLRMYIVNSKFYDPELDSLPTQ